MNLPIGQKQTAKIEIERLLTELGPSEFKRIVKPIMLKKQIKAIGEEVKNETT